MEVADEEKVKYSTNFEIANTLFKLGKMFRKYFMEEIINYVTTKKIQKIFMKFLTLSTIVLMSVNLVLILAFVVYFNMCIYSLVDTYLPLKSNE